MSLVRHFRRKVFLLFTISVFHVSMIFSQSQFLVRHYNRDLYMAGNQNWSLDADREGYLYAGNNDGLLIFDGNRWKIHPQVNQTIVRSVYHHHDGRIFTGSYEEFGFWQRKNGKLSYTSLKPMLKGDNFHNGEIWKIVESKGNIYFQGFSFLFLYNGTVIREIELPGSVIFLLKARDRLFIQAVTGEFYELAGEKLIRLDPAGILKGKEVKTILPYGEHHFLIGTTSDGLFLFDGVDGIMPFHCPADQWLRKAQINNGLVYNDLFLFGTIVNGLLVMDQKGRIVEELNTGNALQNNTILSMTQAPDGTIWLGLDQGIEKLKPGRLITIYKEPEVDLGAVYTAALFKQVLYVGTNKGVFHYQQDTLTQKFHYQGFIDKSQGQVWELREYEGQLYCGHTRGTFIIRDNSLIPVSTASGGYCMKEFRSGNREYMIQGTYSPLVVYEKANGTWIYRNQVFGFQEPARFIQPDHLGNIWAAHVVQGLYKLRLSDNADTVKSIESFAIKDGLPSEYNLKLFSLQNRLVITTGKELFTWDDLSRKIIPYTALNEGVGEFRDATHITDAGKERYWFIRKNEVRLFSIKDRLVQSEASLFLPVYALSLMDKYENLIQIDENQALLCLDNGFAILKTGSPTIYPQDSVKIVFREISTVKPDGSSWTIVPDKVTIRLPSDQNSISLRFCVLNNIHYQDLFQYQLVGMDKTWSEWSTSGEVTYTRLPKGKYTFRVRTLTADCRITEPKEFSFEVKSAWYASTPAWGFYVILLIILIAWIRRRIKLRITRQERKVQEEAEAQAILEKQKSEQEIISLQNEKLQAEIAHKNIQLANSTMALIRKNELLIQIKEEIEKLVENSGKKSLEQKSAHAMNLINQNISSDADWAVFEALFDQAHENFFKRLKSAFPDLTQSDLKLCAYLKLNLSSKEIAPLLNITFRGVETRRYRLRRRLMLDSDENLVQFIMNF